MSNDRRPVEQAQPEICGTQVGLPSIDPQAGDPMTARLLCPIGFRRRHFFPVTEIVEYDVQAGTRYVLVRTGMDAPGHERWRRTDEIVIDHGGDAA